MKNLTGQQSGQLTAVRYLGCSTWECRCSCGNLKNVTTAHFQKKASTSCGCAHGNKKHGYALTGDPTYESWCHMRQRCNNPNTRQYKWYGAKGVTICERWNKFSRFLEDMGPRPVDTMLDRIDPNGNYEPSNCRWAPRTKGRRRSTPMIGNETLREYALRVGLKYHTAYARYKRGKL